jgi:hypothetical protein
VESTSGAAVTLGAGARKWGDVPPLPADLGGLTLGPGKYTGIAATGLTGTLFLDADETGKWTFKIGAAFTTAAASKMVFVSGSKNVPYTGSATVKELSDRVLWDVTGAITLGAGSSAIGKMTASGAITVGATVTCAALEAGGAITVGAGANALSVKSTSGAAVTIGAGAFVVGSLASEFGGMTLVPGDYTGTAATSLTGTVVLANPYNETKPKWTFTIEGAFTTAAASRMVFSNTAPSAAKVEWVVAGAITLGALSTSIGTMKAAAITVGASSTCGILEARGAVTVGANTRYVSASGSAVTLGAGALPVA